MNKNGMWNIGDSNWAMYFHHYNAMGIEHMCTGGI